MYDAGKRMQERKRQIATGTTGLPVALKVRSATIQDGDGTSDALRGVARAIPCCAMSLPAAVMPAPN